MLVDSKELFSKAQQEGFAIPATNFNDLNSLAWLIDIADEKGLPLIAALAEAHLSDEITLERAAQIGRLLAEEADVPIVLHLDHGTNPDIIKKAVDLGFSSVMIDASLEDLEGNIEKTKEIVEYAHPKGVVVEAEIGHVGAGENYEDHEESDSVYTEVEDAKKFVEETGVDSLAVSIGTAHGLYKGTPKINFERLAELAEAIDTPLVLHGGSSSGDENLNRCATNGISKINIFSDFLGGVDKATKEKNPANYIEALEAAHNGYKDVLNHYYEVFETKPVVLED